MGRKTDVPAAVVIIEPLSVNLPEMAIGEVFYGEFSLTNHGLIRADNLTVKLPQEDQYFKYEWLNELPDTLVLCQCYFDGHIVYNYMKIR